MAIKRLVIRPKKSLSTEQKVAFALLIFLGLGGVFFGFQSFGANLYRPIQLQFAKNFTGNSILSQDEQTSKEIELQKTKDTDKDGLSDYDENYVYHTSPYITDSDSDGIDDKSEVFAGSDPNCAQGKDCSLGLNNEQTTDGTSTIPDLLGSVGSNSDVMKAGEMKFSNKEEIEKFLKSATVDEIRKALIESGVSKEEVDKISDADLEKLFQSGVDQAAGSGSFDSLLAKPTSDSSTSSSTVVPNE